jgi:hypothetical protein
MTGSFLKRFLLVPLIAFFIFSCKKDEVEMPVGAAPADHPRIMLLNGEEGEIHEAIAKSADLKSVHETLISRSNSMIGEQPVKRELIGRRLLDKSRKALHRMFFLSYSFRMTGDRKFFKRAQTEMLAVANFSDWNPSHFLDVAEMTAAMAIGYDWLYNEMTDENRRIIRDAIVEKGLEPSFDSNYNWWLRSTFNWNQVCNGGMVLGALAVMEHHPDLAKTIIDRAKDTNPLALGDYEPNGAYPEGYNYWGYGTTYNIFMLNALERLYGPEPNLLAFTGFLQTGNFVLHMIGPSTYTYNWGDCTFRSSLNPALFWFAQRNNDNSVLWAEKRYLEINGTSKLTGMNFLPAVMIWSRNVDLDNVSKPSRLSWTGEGKNPVHLMRTSWEDPSAIYLGFKAGSPSVNHGHMDVGSFILEHEGVRWAHDPGMQNYESLESLGMKIFGKSQDAERWTVFRMGTYSHNVLIVNGEQQRVDGYAKIDKTSSAEAFQYAVSDISSLYEGQLESASRGTGIIDGKYTIIRDEIKATSNPATVRWNMMTTAEVKLTNDGAIMTSDSKTLHLMVSASEDFTMKTWSTAPTNNYDAENPGTIMVGFECQLPANSSQAFEVILVPEAAKSDAVFKNIPLNDW